MSDLSKYVKRILKGEPYQQEDIYSHKTVVDALKIVETQQDYKDVFNAMVFAHRNQILTGVKANSNIGFWVNQGYNIDNVCKLLACSRLSYITQNNLHEDKKARNSIPELNNLYLKGIEAVLNPEKKELIGQR